ncbi:MAG: alpha/beta hydrolase [Jatrophihabitans sp.]|uniref:alpha/beta hydrolase n=1 Tax=Jatrophihabitans sp. TaxID=1932789 RepID=UPI003F7E9594
MAGIEHAGSRHGRYSVEPVSFRSGELVLRGNLYVPSELDEPASAVPILGPYCFVKEQAPVQYATRLADEGFVTLAFDAAHHGASDGEPRRFEDPLAKVADVRAALDFLSSRPEVDADRLAVLGVCEGSSEMLRVAVDDPRVTSIATVSGHYRDADNDVELAGGEALAAGEIARAAVTDRLQARRERGAAALARYEEDGQVEYGAIVDPVRTDVALPWRMIWDWYHGWADRGLWENRYALMSDVPYFAFESLTAAEQLRKPLLMVHADFCDGPDSARRHFAAVPGTDKRLVWQGENSHFQYYEDPAVIDHAVGLAAAWFRDHQ